MNRRELRRIKAQYTKRELWRNFSRQCLGDVLRLLDIETFAKQQTILETLQKVVVLRAARRTSKSFSTALRSYQVLYFCWLFGFDARICAGAPAGEDVRHFWAYMTHFWKIAPLSDIFEVDLSYSNYLSKSKVKKKWEFSDGSYVRSASCDDPRCNDVRGDGWDFVNIDEFGNIPYKDATLEAAGYSTKDKNRIGLLWLVGTHDVVGMGEEFDRLFKLGQGNHPEVVSFTISGHENPHTDKEDAETLRDIVSEAGYLREELGEAVPSGGKLFKDFDIRNHCKTIPYDPSLICGGGADFGLNKPYACLYQPWFETPECKPRDIHINVIWELSPEEQYRIGRFISETWFGIEKLTGGVFPELFGTDPAGDNDHAGLTHTDFAKFKKAFPMARYTHKRQLKAKANQVQLYRWLLANDRIHISEKCPKLLRFFAMASPDTNRVGAIKTAGWMKRGGVDDPGDGFVYGLINYAPIVTLMLSKRKAEYLTPEQGMELAAQMAGL